MSQKSSLPQAAKSVSQALMSDTKVFVGPVYKMNGESKARIVDFTFHDLRGSAATHLFEVGCSAAEVASITNLSMRNVGTILHKYLARTGKIAIAAIKLERDRAERKR